MSLGSLTEIQNQLIIAKDVGYITAQDFATTAQQADLVNKLLRGLIKKTITFISAV